MVTLRGKVKTVTYRDHADGYSVLKVSPVQMDMVDKLVTVVGTLPGVEVSDEVEFHGSWEKHRKFGKQFSVENYQIVLPTSLSALQSYLAAHIQGIGPAFAARIVARFGQSTMEVIEQRPLDLVKIKGITQAKAKQIADSWRKDSAIRNQLIKLASLGLTPKLSLKIITQYEDKAFETVKANPYRLAEDIWGVGFIKADAIAKKLGFTNDSPERMAAAIEYILHQALEDGHVYLPTAELIEQTAELTATLPAKVEEVIVELIKQKILVREVTDAIYLRYFYELEKDLAGMIKLHSNVASKAGLNALAQIDFAKAFAWVRQKQGFALNVGQQQAIKTALTNPIAILTGGPGTGKSTALRALVLILKAKEKKVLLAAPTGRAAKRISELTGYEAKTLHRTLRIDRYGNAYYNQDNPLLADFLIVDEASMLDLILAHKIFASLKPQTHILLVGDDSQLPSVNAGNVLADLIASKRVPLVRLSEIFRQAQESTIVRNAHKINAGDFPYFPKHPTDFYLFREENAQAAADLIVDLVSRRIPQEFGFDPLRDIQVLAPMHKTACGVQILNEKLQSVLNPNSALELRFGSRSFRINDRVMQTSNNYEKEVFNGEIGRVIAVRADEATPQLVVALDDRVVNYENVEIGQLTHAYAVSVHKSQGSEYPVVVMPMVTTHYIMLARNLFYTAVTRAKKLVVLVGTPKAIGISISNNKATKRYTLLKERLKGLSC